MAQLLILTSSEGTDVLPALGLLSHRVRTIPPEPSNLVNAPGSDLIVVDGRDDLAGAKSMCLIIRSSNTMVPVLLILTEGGLAAVTSEWGVTDVLLATAGPAEVDARIRLAIDSLSDEERSSKISASGIVIDESRYSAKSQGRSLDLTFKEFELLRFLALHPGRVFTREQVLSEVWGYDYFGGTRTVDVHVRRLRAKLGDQDTVIGTVRNVGYRFNDQGDEPDEDDGDDSDS